MDSSRSSCDFSGSKVLACPFLRSISVATNFSLWGAEASPKVHESIKECSQGPMFEDSVNFETAFKAFHGDGGVVPLSRSSHDFASSSPVTSPPVSSCPVLASALSRSDSPFCGQEEAVQGASSNGDAFSSAVASAPMATMGLSAFGGGGGPFGFDAFRDAMEARKRREKMEKQEREKREHQKQDELDTSESEAKSHEAGDDWLATGNCPIARSYRAFNRVVPAMAAAFKPPQGVKYVCPPAIVALRAAVAKHPFMKTLRPQAVPIKVLAIGTMGLLLNIPLGAWREHLVKFSPQWILVVHASVPFVAILRKAALMPKYAMAFTIAASIIGQQVGAKLEKTRIAKEACCTDASSDLACAQGLKVAMEASCTDTSSDLACVQGLKVAQRKARRRDLGHGIRGLGLRQVAFDCQLDSNSPSAVPIAPTWTSPTSRPGTAFLPAAPALGAPVETVAVVG